MILKGNFMIKQKNVLKKTQQELLKKINYEIQKLN